MELAGKLNNPSGKMANDSNFADPSDTHAELFLELNNGTKSNPYPSDLSVFNIPKKIKNKYDRIALISYEDQLALLDLNDENTLIITTDWLTWRLCSDRGAHCLHVESALAEWPDEWSDADRHYQKSNEWMYVDGEDITLFRGVSLGKQFYKEFAHISRTYLLLWNSLHRMCRTFQPCQIIYFDICTETDGLDSSLKLFIVESVAAHHEIKILNRSKEVRTENHQHPEIGFINQLTHRSNLKDVLRIFYETFVNFLFSLRIVSSDSKPRVYILLNWLALNGLLQNYNSQKVTPVILASQFPKTIKFFMSCWRRGIYLSKLSNVSLNCKDRQDIEVIRNNLNAFFQESCPEVERVGRNYIQDKVIAAGRLEAKAIEIKQFEAFFKTKKISHLLVGDAENVMCRMILELGSRENIQRDELLNGLFMTHDYCDARSGDHVHGEYVSRQLSWGKHDTVWRNLKKLHIQSELTGYPALDALKAVSDQVLIGDKKALILPLAIGDGVRSLRSNELCALVDTLQTLTELGYVDLRIKLHPAEPLLPYYKKVTDYFGIGCEIFQKEELADHIEWADIVVGPINSGGLVETLALGKPYYPMMVHPSCLSEDLYAGIKPSENMRELAKAIKEKDFPDPKNMLEFLCSRTSIPNAAIKTWEVLEESVTSN